jgi:hypothetical protein
MGAVLLWRAFPSNVNIRNPDLVFAFIAVEIVVMILLVRFARRKTPRANEEGD